MWDADLGRYVDPLYEQWAAEARARYRNAARGSPGETESPWWAGTKAGLYAFFVSGPRNLGVGAFNAGREAVYYVRDVAAVGADAVVTGTGALAGKNWSLGVEEWSQVGRNNQPSNPNFWSDALTNAGRAGLAAGTLGTTEIAIGTYQYAKTGDADAFQQQMGGIAAGNLAGAATIKAGQALRTTARSNAPANVAREPNRIYSARELIRRANEPGPFHNFPESFNRQIFQGNRQVISQDDILYTQRGVINGRSGTFEIGVRPSASGRTEVITHRFFRPDPLP